MKREYHWNRNGSTVTGTENDCRNRIFAIVAVLVSAVFPYDYIGPVSLGPYDYIGTAILGKEGGSVAFIVTSRGALVTPLS
eukprot:3072849-Amphidinium_carterae.1